MSARVDVCNFALTMLGESAIESIDDDLDSARTLRKLYYIGRDAVLEESEWTFATRRFLPAVNAAMPEWGYSYSFPIPSDIIRVIQVDKNWTGQVGISNVNQPRNPVDHVIEGREILCNDSVIYCKGIRRIDDEGIYSPLFVEAFAAKLAYLAAIPITESTKKQMAMFEFYTASIKKAKSRDGMQNSTRRMRNNVLRNAR